MIVLDTNVLSETLRQQPETTVLDWLNAQSPATLFISSVTVAEMMFGVAALPTGQRKDRLRLAVEGLLELFKGRGLPFDTDAACHHATLAIRARESGRGFLPPGGYSSYCCSTRLCDRLTGYCAIRSGRIGGNQSLGMAFIVDAYG